MNTHLIMPMAGAGSRFAKSGYIVPKPLMTIQERPFFFWATRSIEKFTHLLDITFVVLKEHVDIFNIDRKIYHFYPNAKIVVIPAVTQGPVYTCLEGVKDINDDNPIIFNDCDHMFKSNELYDFINSVKDVDGALLTFKSEVPHFSFVKYDENGKIIGTVEKRVVSNRAICGAYYYRSSEIFKKLACEYINNCPYKEPFMSGTYNLMCEHNMYIKDLLVDFHVEFGTPEEFDIAKTSPYFKELC